ncbi:hypothetical protein HS088_TW13G01676 [Tripterygium wilfordii]|uniref:Uncharacterized protein n=2 Tax=Tripterygium wilfordii TaxID=458696 RepID=A0A7J7CXE3_TRIWF|nr:hypothetical protein HS088_TW13G01676 [Tripterygium wilfordii]
MDLLHCKCPLKNKNKQQERALSALLIKVDLGAYTDTESSFPKTESKIQITPAKMKDYQTSQKEHLRSLDLGNRRSKESQLKKLQKIAKKSLGSVFSETHEDVSDPFDSMIAVSELNNVISASSETSILSDLTPTSMRTTKENEQVEFSAINLATGASNGFSVKAEIVANLLIEARSQVLNSVGADHRSKRLLDTLVNIVVDDFFTLPEEKDLCLQIVFKKAVLICFMFWMVLAIVALFFLGSVAQGTSARPLPT